MSRFHLGFGARIALLFSVSAVAGAGALAARGDVIYQPGGGKIVGEILEEKDDYVGIRTRAGGIMRVPRDEIDRIERGPIPAGGPTTPAPDGLTPPRLPDGPQRPPLAPPAAPEGPGGAAGSSAGAPSKPAPLPLPPPAGGVPLQPGRLGGGRIGGPGGSGSGDSMVFGIDEEALLRPRLRAVKDWFEKHGARLKVAIPELLRDRRKTALDFIMDPTKYPEANHGAIAQPEVDRLVALLRRVFEDPFSEAYEISEELRRLVEDLEEVGDSEPIRVRVNKALAPAQEPPPERDQAAIEWNAKGKSEADEQERACVEATNSYRMMFGLKVLRMDDRLLRAGRSHSKAMVELGFFDHGSPVKGSETPERRCALEGASYTGENIAMGMESGRSAFQCWYNSSGHHRNILGEHLSIGIGRHETHWTQDFGKDVPKDVPK